MGFSGFPRPSSTGIPFMKDPIYIPDSSIHYRASNRLMSLQLKDVNNPLTYRHSVGSHVAGHVTRWQMKDIFPDSTVT